MDHDKPFIKQPSLLQTRSLRMAGYVSAACGLLAIGVAASEHTCWHALLNDTKHACTSLVEKAPAPATDSTVTMAHAVEPKRDAFWWEP